MSLVILWTNRATSKLAGAISSTATTLALNPGTGALFPAPVDGQSYFTLSLTDAATKQNHEIMWCTARTGDLLTVTRGQEGTAAQNWAAGDIAANQLTAASLASLGQIAILDAASQLAPFYVQGSPGTVTTTVPDNVYAIYVWCIGAGGGGAACNSTYTGGGGGAGGFAATRIDNLVPGQIISVTVGAGGLQGTAGSDGHDGGTSSVGSWVSCTGGQKGQSIAGPQGGAPGVGSVSVGTSKGWVQYGGYGTNGTTYSAGAGWGGNGGGGFTGGGGGMSTTGGTFVGAAGSGGGGGYGNTAAAGESGQPGFVILWPAVEG